jgi:hypothetical protein
MQCLILDTDALSHASGLALLAHIEAIIGSLPRRAYIERSVYTESVRTGVSRYLDDWMRRGLLSDPIDYRGVPNGEQLFQQLKGRWVGLSRPDRASLIVARAYAPSGILTCEKLLSEAADHFGIFAADLFDVLRFRVRDGGLSTAGANAACATWDRDAFSAGRPRQYRGNFQAEFDYRATSKPLP